MAEILVLANETIGGKNLLDAIRERSAEGDANFHVVVPLTRPRHGNVIYDDAVRNSAQVRVDLALAFMREEGIHGSGEVGDGDPLNAAHDAIAEYGIDEIIVSTLPASTSGWMKRDLIEALENDTGLPVKHVVVDLAAEGLPFDVTLVVANQTVAGKELVTRLEELAAQGPRRFIIVVPQDSGDGRAVKAAPRAPARAARLAGGGRARGRGHDRRPRSLHGHDERRAVLPRLGDRHLDAAGGLVEVGGRQADRARRRRDRQAGRAHRDLARAGGGGHLMEAAAVAHGHEHEHHGPPAANRSSRVDPSLLGMLLFIISEVMVFGAFFTAYFFIRVVQGADWPAPRGRTCRS